jgi:hypothetical protein
VVPGFCAVVSLIKSFILIKISQDNLLTQPHSKKEVHLMPIQDKMAKTIILAGIPFLAFPFLAESGMSGDRSQRGDGGRSFSDQQIVKGKSPKKNGDEITLRSSTGEKISFCINDQTNE